MPNEINQEDKPVVQSPSNDGSPVDHLDSMVEDNATSRELDKNEQDPAITAAVTGANAGADNSSTSSPRRGSRKKPTGFNEQVLESDPDVGGPPAKLDSFGRPGDSPQPRPQMTPDLAEPLRDHAGAPAANATNDAGETTSRLHSAMRAKGAMQYGLIDAPEAQPTAPAAPSGAVGEITDPHHAVSLVKSKVSELHQIIHNIGNVASVPVHAIEALVADIQYLMGVVRSKV